MNYKVVKRSKGHVWIDTSNLTTDEKKWLKRMTKRYEKKQFQKFKRAWKKEHDFFGYMADGDFGKDFMDAMKENRL